MVLPTAIAKGDAMQTVCTFLVKFASVICWALSCFDRVLFRGHLPLSRPYELENFVDYVLKVRRADFMETLSPRWSCRLGTRSRLYCRAAADSYPTAA